MLSDKAWNPKHDLLGLYNMRVVAHVLFAVIDFSTRDHYFGTAIYSKTLHNVFLEDEDRRGVYLDRYVGFDFLTYCKEHNFADRCKKHLPHEVPWNAPYCPRKNCPGLRLLQKSQPASGWRGFLAPKCSTVSIKSNNSMLCSLLGLSTVSGFIRTVLKGWTF